MTNSVSDLLHAGSDPLRPTVAPAQAVRRRAEQRRRHRRIVAVMTPAVLVALILGLSATGELRNSSAPPPPATHGPHPAPALLTLSPHPFRTDIEGARIRAGAPPVALSSCGSSPLTWGAAESSAATYRGAGQPRFANEFVLRYDSVAAAHRAVTDAWREFVDCPTPQHVDTDAGGPPVQSAKWRLSEFFGSERLRRATPRLPRDRAQVATVYSLRVARRQNVVVVVETTSVDDRADVVLGLAMGTATGKVPPIAHHPEFQ